MKINPISILINSSLKSDKKIYFISGNEKTLMEKIKSKIIERFDKDENVQIKTLDSIIDFVDETGLFHENNIFLVNSIKGINKETLNNIKETKYIFIFLQENSQKIKKIKNMFDSDKDSYLVDCYELDKSSKIKILNEFLSSNELKISQEVYWMLIDKLDSRYIFLENSLLKILDLGEKDITLNNVKKILIVDDYGKERIFFNLLKENHEIVQLYRNKVITNSDANDIYYYSKFFCELIIDSNDESEYSKNIPIYLFRERNYLIDIYRKYNSRKKKVLIKLLSTTEKILRKQSGLSLAASLRFLLNIKRITTS